jgi:hypothetical protein
VHTLFPLQGNQPFGVLAPGPNLPHDHPGVNGARYFTIQRVNGNGANGKSEGVGGGHRHTLEDSDRVKKNSVQRHFMKEDKERKKSAVCSPSRLRARCKRGLAAPGKIGYVISISTSIEELRLFFLNYR